MTNLNPSYLDSILSLKDQCLHAFKEANQVEIPTEYQKINYLIMTGMGGSGLGARAIESIYSNSLTVPLSRIHGYDLPSWVNSNSLVFCSSYSGNTEEILSIALQAVEKKAKWIAITNGGELLKLSKHHQVPCYQIDPRYNPSKQPRMAIGYSIFGQLTLASKLKLISVSKKQVQACKKAMELIIDNHQTIDELAQKLINKQVIFIGSEHLAGSIHTIKNQMNENAKHLAHRHDIPELNHHLMEGLKFPNSLKQNTAFILFNSKLYSKKIQKRILLTKKVIEKNNYQTILFQPNSTTKLAQAFESIQFGSFLNYYLVKLHKIDPLPIPWVDYFKKHL